VRGGTVFLDEVGELPLAVQAKLLRVIENREVFPLGSDRPVSVDFRLVAATNRPLQQLVAEGGFREDLYFRLNVVRVELPPLRLRSEDLPELSNRLLARHALGLGRPAPRLTADAITALRQYRWPGNVRELSNVLERSLLLSDGPWLDTADLPQLSKDCFAGTLLKPTLEAYERDHIRRVLALHEGDKKGAAKALGVHLATLYRHLERLGMTED
jgi:transcriptional regulator with PAS, ATPase and Fis domain